MDQRIIDLFDDFTHGYIERRVFLKRLAHLAGGTTAAAAILPKLEVHYDGARQVDPAAAGIRDEYVTYPGPGGDVRAYLAAPESDGPHPGLIVIHENRGLNPHIEDVARRGAVAGFLSVAPDALSPLGGTPPDTDQARTRMRELDAVATRDLFLAAVTFLQGRPDCTGRVGCVGFCWGGAMANQLAVHAPDLGAAVAFYGRQPAAEDVPRMRAALLLHYAGLDERINAGIAAYEAALQAAGVDYLIHMYDGVNHAFHNDTAPTRYDEAAAGLAWQRTVEFLSEKLSG